MTPSDSIEIKQGSLPASVSSASSLDSMHQASRQELYISSDIPSMGSDTRQIENASDPRGDNHGAESQNASRPQQYQGVISPPASAAMPSTTSLSLPTMMLPSNHLGVPVLPSGTPLSMPGTAGNNSIPEFLYQLTKMLTDNNRHIIEWTNGKIEVHSPHRLESEVLHKYFRHSKFASFQRQLNYFGFRKNAGKGKMAPCSYVNEATTNDLSSILLIKRKTTASIAAAKEKKREPVNNNNNTTAPQRKVSGDTTAANPVLAGILQRSNSTGIANSLAATPGAPTDPTETPSTALDSSYRAVAKSAVGRGVRHSFTGRLAHPAAASSAASLPDNVSSSEPRMQTNESQNSLSQLTTNYRNTLNGFHGHDDIDDTGAEHFHFDTDPTPLSQLRGDTSSSTGFFSRDPSLLDLAMIPEMDEGDGDPSNSFSFVDFPNPEVRPKTLDYWDHQNG